MQQQWNIYGNYAYVECICTAYIGFNVADKATLRYNTKHPETDFFCKGLLEIKLIGPISRLNFNTIKIPRMVLFQQIGFVCNVNQKHRLNYFTIKMTIDISLTYRLGLRTLRFGISAKPLNVCPTHGR